MHINTCSYGLALLIACAGILTTDARAQVAQSDLEQRDGLWYEKGTDTPYSGKVMEPDRVEGRVENGKRVGEWVWWNPSGYREYMMVYDAGERLSAVGWHANGQKESEMTYKAGQREGVMRHWDDDGSLRKEQSFVGGKPHGTNTLWDHTGDLLYTAEYSEGVLHGPAIWWYEAGAKRWETHYERGERTGTWSQYDPNGSLRMQTKWKDGLLVSRHNPHANH